MEPYHDINILTNILDSKKVDYILEENTLYLKESLSSCCDTRRCYNSSFSYSDAYEAISRCTAINILDFTRSEGIPPYFHGFPFLEEVRIGDKNILPEFVHCPRLTRVVFSPESIESINAKSFWGWPHIDVLRLGEKLNSISMFSLSRADIKVLDLSRIQLRHLPEHGFQGSHIEKIILPDSVNVLPDYLFFECTKLKEVIAEGVKQVKCKVFENCPQLAHLKFDNCIDNNEFNRILKYGSDEYFLSRCGIIISSDKDYSYIWCFTDFKFYYTERQDSSLTFKIVTFCRSDYRKITKLKDGECFFASEYNNYRADEIRLDGHQALSKEYDEKQYSAISSYERLKDISSKLIEQKFKEYNRHVDSLNIDEIISSFRTDVKEYVITKIGGDDRFNSSIIRRAIYSDSYIDKILPSRHDSYDDSGYTSSWPWTSDEEKKKMFAEDELLKKQARLMYNVESHKNYLKNEYINRLISEKIEIESYLHIDFAKSLLNSIDISICGFDKVFKLNILMSQRGQQT